MGALRERQQPFSRTLHFESKLLTDWLVKAMEHDRESVRALLSSTSSNDIRRLEYQVCMATYDSDVARVWYADRYARLMVEADKPFGESHLAELSERTKEAADERNDLLGGDAFPMVSKPYDKFLARTATLIAQETAAAIGAYRAERGRLPESLEDLVPAYLPELPPDPFTGDPLKYKRLPNGYQLHSVSANRIDDGCRPWEHDLDDGDLVFVPVTARP
jgi:hypothetical protein